MTPTWRGLSGVPFALASAEFFGASTPLAKLLLGAVDPWLLAGVLYLGAGLGLALVRPWLRRLGEGGAAEAPLRRSDLPWLAAVVFFGGVHGPVLLMLGLARTDAPPRHSSSTSRAWRRSRSPGSCPARTSTAGSSSAPWPSSPARPSSPGRAGERA